MRAHRERGHTIAIVSSATPYQVEPVARELGVEHVLCTRLEAQDGVLTGQRGPADLLRARQAARRARTSPSSCDLDLDASYFYTDSVDDLPLLENVGHPRPTNPDRRLAQIAQGARAGRCSASRAAGTPDLEQIARTALAYASLVPSALAGAAVGLLNRSQREAVNMAGPLWADLATALAGVDLRVDGRGAPLVAPARGVHLQPPERARRAADRSSCCAATSPAWPSRRSRATRSSARSSRLAGIVFVDRADSKKAIEALEPALEALREGRSIAIAPEGTRQTTPRSGAFKKGAFHMAMQAGVPIVPIVFRNALDALPKDGDRDPPGDGRGGRAAADRHQRLDARRRSTTRSRRSATASSTCWRSG